MSASSDPTPAKRSNKEGLCLAEIVEGRASPKGNGSRPAAVRTLSREAASTGLVAVRRAARQSRDVRFTALLHHITVDLLRQSYIALEHDAAPGIDGVTWQTQLSADRLDRLALSKKRAANLPSSPRPASQPRLPRIMEAAVGPLSWVPIECRSPQTCQNPYPS
jgi:RNA-directed DNA polymerase